MLLDRPFTPNVEIMQRILDAPPAPMMPTYGNPPCVEAKQTIPTREYWRVWSEVRREFVCDYRSNCEHLAEWPERDGAQKEADRVNAIDRAQRKKFGRHDLWPADYRPVLCREVVVEDVDQASRGEG